MSDIEIAQKATMKPVLEIGASLGIGAEHLEPYGHYKAKISLKYLDSLPKKSDSKLVLVTAISPTPDTNFLLVVLIKFLFLFIAFPFNSIILLPIIFNSYYNFIIFVINPY